MRTRTCVLFSIFLLVAAVIFIFASCDNGAVTPSYVGTWVNSDYDGTSGEGGAPAKVVVTKTSDTVFTVELYLNHDDTTPYETTTQTVTDEWTDLEGNIFLEIVFEAGGDTLYSLSKLHADNQTLENALSLTDYPTTIDPNGWYSIHYRQ